MAADPAFASTPRHSAASVSATADTSRTSITTSVDVFTAGSSGSKIESIVFEGTGSTLAGVVVIWIYDGSTNHVLYEEAVTVVAASTTVAAYRTERTFDNRRWYGQGHELHPRCGWTRRHPEGWSCPWLPRQPHRP